jgi:magnesium transporter
MKKSVYKKKKSKNKSKIGLPPGSLIYTGSQHATQFSLSCLRYSQESSLPIANWEDIKEDYRNNKDNFTYWISVAGLHQIETIKQIGEFFSINVLTIEDTLNPSNRTKFEFFGDCVFVIIKLPFWNDENKEYYFQHVSIIMKNNLIIFLSENPVPLLQVLRERIVQATGKIRRLKADYLFYLIIDICLDHFHIQRENYEEKLDQLAENIEREKHNNSLIVDAQNLKREIMLSKRHAFAIKDVSNAIVRCDSELFADANEHFFRDLHDHCLENHNAFAHLYDQAKMSIDLLLSLNSFRMNEIMKVLTIITTIFLPLNLITGLFGMNFDNMPLLRHEFGFYMIIISIVLFSLFSYFYIKRKNWF